MTVKAASAHLRAAIDLGTNTCLLLIGEWDTAKGQIARVLEDHSTTVRLGQGVDQARMLQPEAQARTVACMRQYAERVRAVGLDPASTTCVATSQARDARNGPEFFAELEQETGFKFRTISGDDEARLTFRGGMLPGMDPVSAVVIDIGGGSTELMGLAGGQSLDIGSVRFTERFLKSDPVTDEQFWACQDAIDAELTRLWDWRKALPQGTQLLAVAGTATSLAQWHLDLREFDAAAIDGTVLTRGDVHRMAEELKWRTTAERSALPGVGPGRADILLAGALILWRAMELLRFGELRVSTRGLRFGILGGV